MPWEAESDLVDVSIRTPARGVTKPIGISIDKAEFQSAHLREV